MKITRKCLDEAEMGLVNLCEDNKVMREAIIETFTNLMNEVEKWNRKQKIKN